MLVSARACPGRLFAARQPIRVPAVLGTPLSPVYPDADAHGGIVQVGPIWFSSIQAGSYRLDFGNSGR